jgi:septal ring factor EnvC (AmiA/AmiB activator)
MVKCNKIFVLIFLLSSYVLSQTSDLETNRKNLQVLREELKNLEAELDLKQQKEKVSYKNYSNLNKQKFYYEKIINALKKQEIIKSNQIELINNEIEIIKKDINKIKVDYSKFIVFNYKYGRFSQLELLFNSKNIRQAIIRLKHLRDFSVRNRNRIDKLNQSISKLEIQKRILAKEIEEKRLINAEKNRDLSLLNEKINSEKKILNELRRDRNFLMKQLSDKKKSEVAIKNLIEKLTVESSKQNIIADNSAIEKEELIESENLNHKYIPGSISFSKLKGKLPFPVSKGKVVSGIGSKKNLRLNTEVLSYGIDILCSDLSVKAVSDGIVSAIEWLPGYGTVIIISHRENFKTVYGHIENIQVTENQFIQAGSTIGYVSNGIEGRILHFQIWNGRQNLDPISWLKI